MKNVLIVDDDENIRRSLRTMLQLTGHRALTAADGLEALKALRHESVDVIISDLVMPRMDGYRLCQMVRQDERCKAVPFIFHTTYTSPADEKLAIEVGADEFLRKPVDMTLNPAVEGRTNGRLPVRETAGCQPALRRWATRIRSSGSSRSHASRTRRSGGPVHSRPAAG